MHHVTSPHCRSIPCTLLNPADIDWDPPVLPGAGRRTAHSPGKHRGVELHQPPPRGDRIRQLYGERVVLIIYYTITLEMMPTLMSQSNVKLRHCKSSTGLWAQSLGFSTKM